MLPRRALACGGDVTTATDVAVARGTMEFGQRRLVESSANLYLNHHNISGLRDECRRWLMGCYTMIIVLNVINTMPSVSPA